MPYQNDKTLYEKVRAGESYDHSDIYAAIATARQARNAYTGQLIRRGLAALAHIPGRVMHPFAGPHHPATS